MDSIKDAAGKAAEAVDEGLKVASEFTRSSINTVLSTADQAYQTAHTGVQTALSSSQTYVDQALVYYKEGEEWCFSNLKTAVEWSISNPYVAYPSLGTFALLSLPVTRRLLYRFTIGRFRSQEAMVKSAESRVSALKSRNAEYGKETQKLESRMKLAEEEWQRGLAKLRATRQELQRLRSAVGKSESVASSLVTQLRSLNKVDNVLKLRAEASSELSSFRRQRQTLDKCIYRIASKDI